MPSRPQRFTAEVLKQGPNFYVVVPASVATVFSRYADRGRVRVFGTLEGTEIRGSLVPRGGGHWLFLHAGMRAAARAGFGRRVRGAGRSAAGARIAAGDRVELVLRAVPWEEVPVARDMAAALRKAGATAAFAAKSASHRHELQRWVDVAETAERRAQRIEVLVAQVKGETGPVKKGPVKTGRAALRRRPLWTCPKCGHVFVNPNQWHSCRHYSLDEPFARSMPAVRRLFQHLRTMVESVGPVHVQAYRDHVAFLVRVRFLGATPKKRWLDVGFWLPKRVESPRFRKVETLTPTDHVHLLRVTRAEDLDKEVLDWVREAYAVGEQRHLA